MALVNAMVISDEIKDKINHTDNYNEIVELLNRVKDNLLSEPEIVSM